MQHHSETRVKTVNRTWCLQFANTLSTHKKNGLMAIDDKTVTII